jgi:hypothetical protein
MVVDPNGTLPTYSSDGVRNDMLSGSIAGYSGADLADISRDASRGGSGPGSFTDRIWGGGMSQVMANAAAVAEKAKNDAAKTTGEIATQGQGSTVSNFDAGKKVNGNITNGVLLDEVIVKRKKLFGRIWDWLKERGDNANDAAETTVSSVVLVATSIVMPIINQVKVISREGIHEGRAYDPNNKVSWAVTYSVKDWEIVRRDELNNKESLSWEEGKEVMQATNSVLLMATPIKYNLSMPGFNTWLLNTGASFMTKKYIKKGVKYSLEDNE